MGIAGAVLLERLADTARQAARQRDHAGRVPLEQFPVDARLVVVALEVAEARELDQVRVARVVCGEQREVRVALLLDVAILGDVDLAADDRLHARSLRLLEELDRARHRAVIGQRDRRHLELGGPLDEIRDPAGPVEDRVLGVDVEVDEGCFRHAERTPYKPVRPIAPASSRRSLRNAPQGTSIEGSKPPRVRGRR